MARILVIDDAPDMRRLVQAVLQKAGHRVLTAASADEGLAELRRSQIDLTLLDLEMPEKDGATCLGMIRSDPALARIPVLMVTATPVREVVLRVAQLGIEGVVIKQGDFLTCLAERILAVLAAPATGGANPAKPVPGAAVVAARAAAGVAAGGAPTLRSAVQPATVASSGGRRAQPQRAAVVLDDEADLPPARANELLRALQPLGGPAKRLDALIAESVGVRALKPAVQQVLQRLDQPDHTTESVADAIRQDPALSLRILKIANSALYGRKKIIDTVSKAVLLIGVQQLRSAVLSISVLDTFAAVQLAGHLRSDWFWEHSIACGLLASRLAHARGQTREQCDALSIEGLVHDVGRLFLGEQLPEEYTQVCATAEQLGLPLEAVEARLLPLGHADVTARLLTQWTFPPAFIRAVALHHQSAPSIRHSAASQAEDVLVLALADRLAHALLLGCSGNPVLYPLEPYLEPLQIDAHTLVDSCAKAADETADTRTRMLMHADAIGESYFDSVRRCVGDARPLTLTPPTASDAVTILMSRLWPASEPNQPNVIVLSVPKVSDRDLAVRQLAGADTARQMRPEAAALLPVLWVGGGADCLLPPDSLGDRPVRQVTLPVRVDRLLSEISRLVALDPRAPATVGADSDRMPPGR